MAEAFMNRMGSGHFLAESAGLEPREINPLVLEVMKETGYDLSKQKSDSVFEFYKEGRLYDFVIYVCDKETEEKCPIFPGLRRSMSWPFPDPAMVEGGPEERIQKVREIREEIRAKVEQWIGEIRMDEKLN
jgi:arsenate reductase